MSLLNSLQRNFLNSYATIVFAFAICHWQANGKAPHSPIIRHLPIRFSELANTPHSPVANAEANAMSCHWLANGKWRMIGEG